jgi:hypothetical protein
LAIAAAAIAVLVAGCSDLPSKNDALEIIQHEIKEEASCTLPIPLLGRLKMQHTTHALCAPREGSPTPDAAVMCLDALVAAGVTKRMPGGYMAEWPDEVSAAGFDSVSPYDRRARELVFKGCFEMTNDLRDGRFRCGQARADHVIKVTKKEEKRALVRYARAITLDPHLAAIDAACGATTRPAPEATITLEKTENRWALASGGEGRAPASSASTPLH